MDTVIVAATRSAIGSFGGSLAPLSAVDIGTQVLQGLLAKAGVDGAAIDEVILGQVLAAGCGQNPAGFKPKSPPALCAGPPGRVGAFVGARQVTRPTGGGRGRVGPYTAPLSPFLVAAGRVPSSTPYTATNP